MKTTDDLYLKLEIKELQRKLDHLTGGLSSDQLNRKRGLEIQIKAKQNKLKEF